MRYKRVNTLAMDVSAMPAFPSHDDILFILENLKLDPRRMKSVQIHSSRKLIYFGLPDDQSAVTIAARYKKGFALNSWDHPIKVSCVDEDLVDVRVRDLPPETPNNIIEDTLRKYGDVLTVTNEVWKDFYPGALTGVRVARMKITTNIPSFVTFGSSLALVKYRGQIETCRKCSAPLHKNAPCKTTAASNAKKTPVATPLKESNTTTPKDNQQQQNQPRPTSQDAPAEQPATSETMETDDAAPGFITVKRKKDRAATCKQSSAGSDRDSDGSSQELSEEEMAKLEQKDAMKLGPDQFAKWLALKGGAKKFKK